MIRSIRSVIPALLTAAAFVAQAAPVITPGAIYNNASYARDGALNRGIAQGSVFAIFGKGLGGPVLAQVQSFPLPKELAGTSVQVTVDGTTLDAYPLYVTETQVGVMLPSNTPVGAGRVTVTVRGETSAPEAITVVRRNFGVFTANQAGSGPAIAQNFVSDSSQPLNTLVSPARAGQTVILWGTGLGPSGAGELNGPVPGNLDAGMTVWVGGVEARVRYTGRSGCCAGTDQIVFDVPAGVQGCYVPVQVAGAGLLSTPENATIPLEHTVSNSVTISVANDQNVCTDPSGL